jgi:hypothetical protein
LHEEHHVDVISVYKRSSIKQHATGRVPISSLLLARSAYLPRENSSVKCGSPLEAGDAVAACIGVESLEGDLRAAAA